MTEKEGMTEETQEMMKIHVKESDKKKQKMVWRNTWGRGGRLLVDLRKRLFGWMAS